MAAIDGVNNTAPTAPTTNTTNSSSTDLDIDVDSYLNLFISALTNQDPMEPMSNGEIMEQMTQIIGIQNTTQMSDIIKDLAETVSGQNPIGNYINLMGKTVKIDAGNGSYAEGQVLSVGNDEGEVLVELEDGSSYPVSSIVGATQN